MSGLSKKIQGDKVIWLSIVLLSLFSILAIFSSVSALAYARGTSTYYYLAKQVFFICIGFSMMFVCHRIPIAYYKNFSSIILFVSICLLFYMLIFGVNFNDGQRWIRILGFTFQPADIAKISTIIYLAKILENNEFDNFKSILKKILIPVGLVCTLIFIGNISTSILLMLTCFSILFIGGIKIKFLFQICCFGFAMFALLFLMGITLKWPPRVATAVNRIVHFVDKNDNEANKTFKELTSNFQAEQAKIAVASGGIVGKGPGNSTQRYVLPHPYSDFIYAIIIEEYGLIIGVLVLSVYLWLLYRAVIIAKKCTRIFSSVLVLGLMLMIVFQAMINMGVSVGVFPVTGQTLPFVSQGGSSMLFRGISFGIILSISRTADAKKENEQLDEITGLEQMSDTEIT